MLVSVIITVYSNQLRILYILLQIALNLRYMFLRIWISTEGQLFDYRMEKLRHKSSFGSCLGPQSRMFLVFIFWIVIKLTEITNINDIDVYVALQVIFDILVFLRGLFCYASSSFGIFLLTLQEESRWIYIQG